MLGGRAGQTYSSNFFQPTFSPTGWISFEHGITISSLEVSHCSEQRPTSLALIDRWLLASLQTLTKDVSEAFETFQFNTAIEAIRKFTWHSLADDYLEAIKYRLLPGRDPADLKATRYCLKEALLTICKPLAPICPHISEAIYHQLSPGKRSVDQESWPEPPQTFDDAPIHDGKRL